ncbi:MAG: hypothetical protein ACOCUF_03980 [Patescibacteria group bacterium]
MSNNPGGISKFNHGFHCLNKKVALAAREMELEDMLWDFIELNYELMRFGNWRSLILSNWEQSIWARNFGEMLERPISWAKATLEIVKEKHSSEEIKESLRNITSNEEKAFILEEILNLSAADCGNMFILSIFINEICSVWQEKLNDFLENTEGGREISKLL